ncbi:MAG: hypothetical protein JO246_01235 [Frankiaceae bacterium]|nr:hypothetical protein [Frankiaceae bacterium]MBV9869500.1 hypothetical protein [Frankiaceae bacterium]
MDRSARRCSLVVLALVGVVAGCSGGGSSGGGTPAAGGGTTPTVSTSSGGPLFDSDFSPVCEGATQSRATPYDNTAATHKAFYFETFDQDLINESDTDLPSDWTIQYSASDPTAFAGIDIVACGVRTSSKFVKTCTGYKDSDGKELGTLDLYTAKYTLSVHEATTGKTLSSTNVSATDTSCPSFASFDSGETKATQYDSIPKATVVAALKPFVQP